MPIMTMDQQVKRTVQDEAGFSLLEMLVVLMIFMIISSSVIIYTTKSLGTYTNEQYIDKTELIIRMAQLKAMEDREIYNVKMDSCSKILIRKFASSDSFYEETLPDHLVLYISTSNRILSFNQNGNVRTAGSMVYHFNDTVYEYSLNIGKGRLIGKKVVEGIIGSDTCRNTASTRHFIFYHIFTHSPNRLYEKANYS